MPTLEFDERKLLTELEQLTDRSRAAFAAACAERQFQCYVRYSETSKNGDHHKLARALGCIWEDLGKAQADHTALERQLEVCMSLLPSGEPDGLDDREFAENAVASVAFAIRARITGVSQEAVWAARRAYESLDHYVTNRLNPIIIEPNVEARILPHPLVQAELERQQVDLSQLHAAATTSAGESEAIHELHLHSQNDALFFLDSKLL
jgi:Protein of unknown function (DUF416)